jgi:hypothetical protein
LGVWKRLTGFREGWTCLKSGSDVRH